MSDLKTNLEAILQEKQEKIIPENIKKDVQIFDIIGTYTGENPSSEGVKLFETVEEMRADPTAKNGDLAIVYKNRLTNMTVIDTMQYITFPKTVILPEAFDGFVASSLASVDTSFIFNGMIILDPNTFSLRVMSQEGRFNISYTSEDGTTYTRTDSVGNPVDMKTVVKFANAEEWNDMLGYFMQIEGNEFAGLYKYVLAGDTDNIVLNSIEGIGFTINGGTSISDFTYSGSTIKTISFDSIKTIMNSLQTKYDVSNGLLYTTTTGELKILNVMYNNENYTEYCEKLLFQNSADNCIGVFLGNLGITDLDVTIYDISETFEVTENSKIKCSAHENMPYIATSDININSIPIYIANIGENVSLAGIKQISYATTTGVTSMDVTFAIYANNYIAAPNQYTLESPEQLVNGISAYGKNGNITGSMMLANYQLKDLEENGIDISGVSDGENIVYADDENTTIALYCPQNIAVSKNSYFPATFSNSYMVKAGKITPEIIVEGNTVFGVKGTASAGSGGSGILTNPETGAMCNTNVGSMILPGELTSAGNVNGIDYTAAINMYGYDPGSNAIMVEVIVDFAETTRDVFVYGKLVFGDDGSEIESERITIDNLTITQLYNRVMLSFTNINIEDVINRSAQINILVENNVN